MVLLFRFCVTSICRAHLVQIIQEGLEICASLELWMLYLERARRSGAAAGAKTEHNARADITAAFELALQHVG